MSERFVQEKQRYIDICARLTQIFKDNKLHRRYRNKNDVLAEALDALEAKIKAEA